MILIQLGDRVETDPDCGLSVKGQGTVTHVTWCTDPYRGNEVIEYKVRWDLDPTWELTWRPDQLKLVEEIDQEQVDEALFKIKKLME